MKIQSPVGEYDYRLERVQLRGQCLEVRGRLGQWETTTVIEPADFLNLLRKSVFPLVLAGTLWAVTRRLSRVLRAG